MTEQRRFHNRLRILASIDRHELVEAGVIAADDLAAWEQFRANPWSWAIHCSDERYDRLWSVIERRERRD